MNKTIEKILDLIAMRQSKYDINNTQLIVNDSEICSDIDYRLYDRNTEISYIDDSRIVYFDGEYEYTIEENILAVKGIDTKKVKRYLNKEIKKWKSYIDEHDYKHELIMNNMD